MEGKADGSERPFGGNYVVVGQHEASSKRGILFVEARIRDDLMNDPHKQVMVSQLREDLEKQLSLPNTILEVSEDIMANERTATMKLGSFYGFAKDALQSLKVVEYLGPKTNEFCYNSNNVSIKVQVYALYHTPRSFEENRDFPEAEITLMPHVLFEGIWEELVFENDIKGDLIWMMTNILRFSQCFHGKRGEMSPLVLLYGPSGTGKTSLCQGLAQKISIRLNSTYKETTMIQIKTAALLSKYYSESAKQVDRIFTKIACMCQENPEMFICVLIDEIESIASSRQCAMKRSESQDSLRATNALLTGLDRTRSYRNLIFLCTSNMMESLDSAFVDRCGLKRSVDPPSLVSQYEILRSRTQNLIIRGVIQSLEVLPPYEEAEYQSDLSAEYAGSRLLAIVKLIRSENADTHSGAEISGRSLTQLPEQAILKYLREEECDLDLAFRFMERFILSEQSQPKADEDEGTDSEDDKTLESFEGIELRGRKRNLKIVLEEDCTIEKLEEVLGNLRRRNQQRNHRSETEKGEEL